MPRPPLKRHRQNSFGAKKRANIPDQSAARQILERKVANKPLGKKSQDSDDSDGLVTTRTAGRNRKGKDLYASGAVAKGDKPGSYPTRAQARQTLRENTDEILSQRSRSASRTTTPAPSSDKENSGKETTTNARPVATDSAKTRRKGASILVNGSQPVSHSEPSVLGNIKPRKRQASILRLIENDPNESSIVNSDDEDQFLPDAISTPVASAKNVSSPVLKSAPTSLKRKRGSDARVAVTSPTTGNRPERIAETPRRSSPARLEPPSRTQQQKLQRSKTKLQSTEDIMALPESSGDEQDADEVEEQPRKRSRDQVIAPSTLQLQSLMPSKNHIKLREKPARNQFDIPEDSAQNSDEDDQDEDEHSAFVPSKSRRAQTRTTNVAKAAGRKDKPVPRSKDQNKSTNASSHTPSSVRIRTPLPLSSTRTRGTQAKSPAKQGTAMLDKSANTPSRTKPTKGAKKQYGGSRRRAAGKENESISLSSAPSSEGEAITVTKSDAQNTDSTPMAADAKAWNRKWADIDDFSLDFEDVSPSTQSSSLNAR